MIKLTDKSANSTSFHDTVIRTTVSKLRKAIGDPQGDYNNGDDKTNFDWTCETSDGEVFTIYDWKEYRKISEDEVIEFHIGGRNGIVTEKAKRELLEVLR